MIVGQPDDCLWLPILRGKQKQKRSKAHPNTKLLPIFQKAGTKKKHARARIQSSSHFQWSEQQMQWSVSE